MGKENFKVLQEQGKCKKKEEEEKEADLKKNIFFTLPMFEPKQMDPKKAFNSSKIFLTYQKKTRKWPNCPHITNNFHINAGSSGKSHLSTKYFSKNNL